MALTPRPLIDYEQLLKSRDSEEPASAMDIAKAVALNALDPFGIYRAAGAGIMKYLDRSSLTDDDASNLQQILKAGQDAGCDELEIEMDKDRFLGLKGQLSEPNSGINAKIEAGASGKAKYKIKAKYK